MFLDDIQACNEKEVNHHTMSSCESPFRKPRPLLKLLSTRCLYRSILCVPDYWCFKCSCILMANCQRCWAKLRRNKPGKKWSQSNFIKYPYLKFVSLSCEEARSERWAREAIPASLFNLNDTCDYPRYQTSRSKGNQKAQKAKFWLSSMIWIF